MTTAPEPRLDIAERTLAVLLTQFKGKPVFEQVLRSYAAQAQELELVFWRLAVLTTLEYATGVQLDGLGAIVGEPRNGRPDDLYRAAIRSRIRLNRSFATVEEILAVLLSVAPFQYRLKELGYASLSVEVVEPLIGTNILALFTALNKVRAAGVYAELLYHGIEENNVFTLASGDVDETDTIKSLADDASTTGGFMSDVL